MKPNLLFLGTEFGLFVSIDGGQQWAQYKGSRFPAVAVRDLAIQPRTNDLVLGTHGRGIWIIDDITPLRSLTPDLLTKEASFVPGGTGAAAAHREPMAAGRMAPPSSPATIRPTPRSSPIIKNRVISSGN